MGLILPMQDLSPFKTVHLDLLTNATYVWHCSRFHTLHKSDDKLLSGVSSANLGNNGNGRKDEGLWEENGTEAAACSRTIIQQHSVRRTLVNGDTENTTDYSTTISYRHGIVLNITTVIDLTFTGTLSKLAKPQLFLFTLPVTNTDVTGIVYSVYYIYSTV